jgi:hypothetical protein
MTIGVPRQDAKSAKVAKKKGASFFPLATLALLASWREFRLPPLVAIHRHLNQKR